MAFVCTIDDPLVIDFIVSDDLREHMGRLAVGYCDETGCVYSLFVALAPVVGYDDRDGRELTFNIIEAQSDGSHIRHIWDGLLTLPLIPDAEHRNLICEALHVIVYGLVERAKPGMVFFTTHSPNLPQKALCKFYGVLDVLKTAGYTGGKTDSWNGRHAWMADRNEQQLPL